MARFATGDDIAFERLFAMIAPRLHAFFLRSFPDIALADSLMETTLLRLHLVLTGPAMPERSRRERSLDTWIFTVAASVRREELRRRYGLPADAGETEIARAEPAPDPGRQLRDEGSNRGAIDAVRAAVARLPESQRVVLHLREQEGLTFEQIAEALGVSSEAVRSRAVTAYQRLQADLGGHLRSKGTK